MHRALDEETLESDKDVVALVDLLKGRTENSQPCGMDLRSTEGEKGQY